MNSSLLQKIYAELLQKRKSVSNNVSRSTKQIQFDAAKQFISADQLYSKMKMFVHSYSEILRKVLEANITFS